MPPKRKRSDDTSAEPESSTRATRSSTRLSIEKTATIPAKPVVPVKKTTAKAELVTLNRAISEAEVPAAKKSKTKSHTKKAGAVVKAKKQAPIVLLNDEGGVTAFDAKRNDDHPHAKSTPAQSRTSPSSTTTTVATPVPPSIAKVQSQTIRHEPYSSQRSLALFNDFVDADDPDVIGPQGFENLCEAANIPLDGAQPLVLAWQLGAKEMGKFTKDEWLKGTDLLKVSSLSCLALAVTDLNNLLILGHPPVKKSTRKDLYERTSYWSYADNTKAAFQKLYVFCFALAKPEQSRNIDMETAAALWSVVLVPKYPIVAEVVDFINEKGSYRAVNKDLWSMMLEFCQTVKPTLEDYEADGAWPTLLDDFVSWKRNNANEMAEML